MPFPPLYLSTPLDGDLTVNDVLLRWPAATRVLHAYGFDTCCAGARTLRASARNAGVRLDVLLEDLAAATGEARSG